MSPLILAIESSIEGISDSELEENIETHLLSLRAPTACRSFTDFTEVVQETVTKASTALGYYHVKVRDLQPKEESECKTWQLTLSQGGRVKVTAVDVSLEGEGADDKIFTKSVGALPVKTATYLRHGDYEKSKRLLTNTALEHGYFDFRFTSKVLRVDPTTNSAQVELAADTGPRYLFGDLKYKPERFPIDVLESLVTFEYGEQFNAQKLNLFNENLRKTGYFQNVIARPRVSEAQGAVIPIEIVASLKPRDIISVGGGVSSDTGARVKLNWHRPWITDGGHSLSASLFVSRPEKYVSVEYKIPISDPLTNYYSVKAGIRREQNNDTDSTKHTVSIQHHQPIYESDWRLISFLRFDQESFIQADQPEETTRLLIPGVTVERLRSRGGLDLTWGDKQLLTIEGAQESLLSDIDYGSIMLQSKWVRSYGKHRFYTRVELGALTSSDFEQVPSSLRFFAGGDQSVRGFDYEGLAPEDEEGKLLGGRYLYTGSIEYSYPVKQNWRMAVFLDAGNASDSMFDSVATGFGFGAIWNSPVGPVRFYLAQGNNGSDETRWFHISMGPAL